MATWLGVAGTFLVFLAIFGAIDKLASLLLPSLSKERQGFFAVIAALILTKVAVTMQWDTYFSIAAYLLKTLCSMLLLHLLHEAISAVVIALVPSAVEKRYNEFTPTFTYTATIVLSKLLRMPCNSTLEIMCLLLFWILLWGSIAAAAEQLVPSAAMKSYPVFTSAVHVALMFLGTRILWIMMSWSMPIQKPTALTIPSASTSSTLDSQMNMIFTAIQEMKVQNKRDVGMMLSVMTWMIKIPIFVFIILVAAIAWIIKFLKKNSHELIITYVSKVTEFAKISLGPRRYGIYRRGFRFVIGDPEHIGRAASQVFSQAI